MKKNNKSNKKAKLAISAIVDGLNILATSYSNEANDFSPIPKGIVYENIAKKLSTIAKLLKLAHDEMM